MGKGKVIFIKNAMLLTATGLVLRLVGMVFRVWLASAIGAEGMGLYQQIFSVYAFVTVFASSGVGLAVTRLISEELTLGCRKGVDMVLGRSMAITLAVAVLSGGIVFFGAQPISVYIMSDTRAVSSLKIMTFSLPFMGVSAVLKGYFFARKRAFPNSSSQLLEQAVRILFIVTAIGGNGIDVEDGCAAVLFGDALAELVSAAYLTVVYLFDRRKIRSLTGRPRPPYRMLPAFGRIVAPIAGGRYLNSFLRTVENMLVPANLIKSGLTGEAALSGFGMIKGMALPLLLFPAGLISSVTSLLVPEVSEAKAAGHNARIKYAAEKSIAVTFVSSIPFAVGFFFTAQPLGELIYGETEVGSIVKALAPLVPLMYVDSVSDALLKALDRQMVTFRHAILDSLGRIAAILAFLPFFGMTGFIVIMYASNLFTALLNLFTLMRVSGAGIKVLRQIILPLVTALAGALLADTLAGLVGGTGLVYIMLVFAGIFAAYLPMLRSFDCIGRR